MVQWYWLLVAIIVGIVLGSKKPILSLKENKEDRIFKIFSEGGGFW